MTTYQDEQGENGTNPQASALSYEEVNRSGAGVVNPVAPENVNSGSTHSTELTVWQAAQAMYAAGLNVVPVRKDGSKTPELPQWRKYIDRRTTWDQLWSWFGSNQATGVGVIYGEVSGNVELIEFEGRALAEGVFDEICEIMEASGLGEVWDKICTGWAGQSPSGGMHLRVRVTGGDVPGNTKLASRLALPEELTARERQLKIDHPNKKIPRGLIETRGEGGFGVCEPSHGKVHPSGKPYRSLAGGPHTIPTIDIDTLRAVHDVLRMADRMPKPDAPEWRGRLPKVAEGQLRPGDDFNQRGDLNDLLTSHGWTYLYNRGDETFWCRPGKDKGVSATVNYRGSGKLYVFTTSTEFDNERAYSPFSAFTTLEHAGNFSKAASALARQGYGDPLKRGLPSQRTQSVPAEEITWQEVEGEHVPVAVPVPKQAEPGRDSGSFSILLPAPKDPMAVVRMLENRWRSEEHERGRILLHWQGGWMWWRGSHWEELTTDGMRARLYPILENASYLKIDAKGNTEEISWAPNRTKVGDLLEAMAAVHHLPPEHAMQSWLRKEHPQAKAILISCENGLLDVETRQLHPHSPWYFNQTAVPFAYDAQAPVPVQWLAFLHRLWGHDPDAIAALQEWFGYVLSGRTNLQKMLFIVGPTRSGKGTIAKILTALAGERNVAGPTLSSLATNFGLSKLIGASLGIIADARLPRQGTEAVVERLLSISGEDTLDVDRKNRTIWTGKLPTRLMMLSNDLPPFNDNSGAVIGRMITLTLTRSFAGEEDLELYEKLLSELPGIFNWALEGLDRLRTNGRITEPASSAQARASMDDTVSPIKAFVRDRCRLDASDPTCRVSKDTLWMAWVSWCVEMDRNPSNRINFGRMLFSAAPGLGETRPYVNGKKVTMYQGLALAPQDGPSLLPNI